MKDSLVRIVDVVMQQRADTRRDDLSFTSQRQKNRFNSPNTSC